MDGSFANDSDPKKGASYTRNWGGESLICHDVAHLTVSDLPGSVDPAWASPPCVGASLAGKRKVWALGVGVPGLHARPARRGPRARLIAIENVVATLTSLGGVDFDRI